MKSKGIVILFKFLFSNLFSYGSKFLRVSKKNPFREYPSHNQADVFLRVKFKYILRYNLSGFVTLHGGILNWISVNNTRISTVVLLFATVYSTSLFSILTLSDSYISNAGFSRELQNVGSKNSVMKFYVNIFIDIIVN